MSQQPLKKAIILERLTIAWMLIEAFGSFGAAAVAKSALLFTFGADSLIELISAGLLYSRWNAEAKGTFGDEVSVERREKRTSRLCGILLFLLAAFILQESIFGLIHHEAAAVSILGMLITLVAAFGMPILASAKLKIADEIKSSALRADAMESLTCGYLSWAILAGLAANALFHWWWLDRACSLLIIPLLIKEGKEAIWGCKCE